MDVFTYGMDRWMMYSTVSCRLPPATIRGGPLTYIVYESHVRMRPHMGHGSTGMTQNMDMTTMAKMFNFYSFMNFGK